MKTPKQMAQDLWHIELEFLEKKLNTFNKKTGLAAYQTL